MKASILDLRYKTKEVLRALRNRELVTVLYHGVPAGIIHPADERQCPRVQDTQFFGMNAKTKASPLDAVKRMRQNRYAL